MDDEFAPGEDSPTHANVELSTAGTVHVEIDPVQEHDWRLMIFAIFRPLWITFQFTCIMLNVFIQLYSMIYKKEYSMIETVIYYVFELFYLTDTIFGTLHRNWTHIQSIRPYKPRTMTLIILSFITLIPYYEIYLMLLTPGEKPFRDYCRVKILLRYIILSCNVYSSYGRIANILMVIIKDLFILLNVSMIFSMLWFFALEWIEPLRDEHRMWVNKTRRHFNFDEAEPFSWSLVSFVTTMYFVTQNLSLAFKPDTLIESCIAILLILIGFYALTMVKYGRLLAVFTHQLNPFIRYCIRIDKINGVLMRWRCPPDLCAAIMSHYTLFWQRCRGSDFRTKFFYNLPKSIQKDLTLDIFWEALSHSHIFADAPLTIKRVIASVMTETYLLPNTYIYRADDLKTRLVYIVNGDMQILAETDGKTPILNLSGGSLIAETACLMALPNNVSIRTATACTVHILQLTELYRALAQIAKAKAPFQRALAARIATTKRVMRFKRTLPRHDTAPAITTMNAFKAQWRLMHKITNQFDLKRFNHILNTINGSFMHTYLDLYVFNDSLETELEAICLRNKCPFVMEGASSLAWCFHVACLVATIINVLALPYCVAVLRELPMEFHALSVILDVFYWIELYLEAISVVRTNYTKMADPTQISQWKLQNVAFLCDIFACLPLDYIILLSHSKLTVAAIRLNRLLYVYKPLKMVIKWDAQLSGNLILKKFVKYIALFAFVTHLCAFVMYFVSTPYEGYTDGWFQLNIADALNTQIAQDAKYGASMLASFAALLRVGFVNLYYRNLLDLYTYLAVSLLGQYLMTFAVAEIVSLGVHTNMHLADFDATLRKMKRALKGRSEKLSQEAKAYYEYLYYNRTPIFTTKDVFLYLPETLQERIVNERLYPLFAGTLLFQLMSKPAVLKLCRNCLARSLGPGTIIISQGMWVNYLYIIERGTCKVLSDVLDRNVEYMISEYQVFPELTCLFDLPALITVTAVTDVELVLVPKEYLINICKAFDMPYIINNLNDKTFDELLRTREIRASVVEEMREKTARVEVIDAPSLHHIFQYMRRRRWHRILWHTIEPHGRFFVTWEIVKCAMVIFQLLLIHYGSSVLFRYSETIVWIQYGFDIYGIVDIAIRCHLQYYNKHGLVVSNVWYTLQHYVTTSMAIDCIGIAPLHFLRCDHLFFMPEHWWYSYHVLILVTRLFKVYRVNGILCYIIGAKRGWQRACAFTALMVFYFYVIYVLFAFVFFHQICDIQEDEFYVDCSFGTYSAEVADRFIFTWYLTYIPFAVMSAQTSPALSTFERPHIPTLALFAAVFTVFWVYVYTHSVTWLVCKTYRHLTDASVVGNAHVFALREYVDVELVRAVVDESVYRRRCNETFEFVRAMATLNDRLANTVLHSYYWQTLMSVGYFDGDECCCKMLLPQIQIAHFMRDSAIVQTNDVQGRLFVIHGGRVSVAVHQRRHELAVLRRGGTFGCLSRCGATRQTVGVTALTHTEVIYFNSQALRKTLKAFPHVERKIRFACSMHEEYAPGLYSETTSGEANHRTKWFRWKNKRIFIERMDYLFDMHVLPWFSCISMALFLYAHFHEDISNYFLFVFYTIDLIYLAHILIWLVRPYENIDTGEWITAPRLIWKKYRSSYKFYVDISTLLPVELPVALVFGQSIMKFIIWNRFPRLVHFFVAYARLNHAAAHRSHLIATGWFLFYLTINYVFCLSTLWILIICDGCKCPYYEIDFRFEKVHYTQTPLEATVKAMLYAVNLFVRGSLDTIGPTRLEEMLFYVFFYQICAVCTILVFCIFANLFNAMYFAQVEYFHNLAEFVWQLKRRELSPVLIRRVTKYLDTVWIRTRGEIVPRIILDASPALREPILWTCYSACIGRHFLFDQTHVDFLRQLYGHVDRTLLIPSHQIVHQSDVDGSMYFVKDGEVEAHCVGAYGFEFRTRYTRGEAFGELSGLFNEPHHATYTCITCVDLLVLHRSKWQYLLDWFPASRNNIFEAAEGIRQIRGRASVHIDAGEQLEIEVLD